MEQVSKPPSHNQVKGGGWGKSAGYDHKMIGAQQIQQAMLNDDKKKNNMTRMCHVSGHPYHKLIPQTETAPYDANLSKLMATKSMPAPT